MMGWKGESRRHSLSRKGIKTNIGKTKRFDVSNFVARGEDIEYIGEQKISVPKFWDERRKNQYLFKKANNKGIIVEIYRQPDHEMMRRRAKDEKWTERMFENIEDNFYEKGMGEVHVIDEGTLIFSGTEKVFKVHHPELYNHLKDKMITMGTN